MYRAAPSKQDKLTARDDGLCDLDPSIANDQKQNEKLHLQFLNLSVSASSRLPPYPSTPLSDFPSANPTQTTPWSAYL